MIKGDPNLHLTLAGGVAGDSATVASLINIVPRLLGGAPGLRLMTELAVPSSAGQPAGLSRSRSASRLAGGPGAESGITARRRQPAAAGCSWIAMGFSPLGSRHQARPRGAATIGARVRR